MKRLQNLIAQSDFLRNVVTLMPGTLLSQAIPILFSIILARVYSPELFGIYFVFTAILSLVIIFATGKYELAILLPPGHQEGSRLIGVAMSTCIIFCMSLLLLFFAFQNPIIRLLNTPGFERWLLLIPVSLFFSAANEIFYYWHNRMKRYSVLSYSKIIQSLTSAVFQLGLGFWLKNESGLILGLILGQVVSFAFLAIHYRIRDLHEFGFTLFKDYKELAGKYIRFPRDIASASFVNEMSNQIPNLFMSKYLGQRVLGHYGYAQRTLRTPLGVISNAFSDVFKSRAAAEFNANGTIRSIFLKTFRSLFLLSFVPFLILFFTAPWLFSIIFGSAYAESGVYARIFCIPLFLNFVVSPLTSSFYIINRTRIFLFLQIIGLVLVISGIASAWLLGANARMLMVSLSAALSINVLIVFSVLLVLIKGSKLAAPAS